ncbi:MAG TPA: metallophosphoesterase [Pyrinomonadaceae bacterium]|nr:metallophosphoesterase [Pyrinomonadaceae bacterium]
MAEQSEKAEGTKTTKGETDPGRRRFLKGLAAAGLVSVSAASGYGWLVEPFNYELTETEILIKELPDAFENFRIAQLTDIHHSRLVPLAEVRQVVALARAARPDMFVLTGDYTTSRRSFIEPCAEALGALDAPAGVWAVLGNHDHNNDAELTTRSLTRYGINVLNNTSTNITRGADALQLAGIDDLGWGKADWERALRGLDARRPSLLLSHEPAVFDLAETRPFSLILSGHTHGGQITLPFVGAPARFLDNFRYLRGLYARGTTQLYVSRGTGMIGLPIRLGARPEIAVLRLRRAPTAG